MENILNFRSRFIRVGLPLFSFTDSQIEEEPGFFSSSIAYAREKGGPITHNFLDSLPEEWKHREDAVFDSRVHMLMKGFFPAIPGWHLDDIPRDSRKDGQPEHSNPSYRANHILAIVGDASRTVFLDGDIMLKDIPDGQWPSPSGYNTVYGEWHRNIENVLQANLPFDGFKEVPVESGQLYEFNDQSFHRGDEATKAGWRWFGRISINTKRKAQNKIRTQTQVYLTDPYMGW